MRETGFLSLAQTGNTPSFGRKITAEELDQIRPLVRQVPRLGDSVADSLETRFCSVMDSPASKLGMFFRFPLLAVEAIIDHRRTNRAVKTYRNEGGKEPVVSLQWVRFPTNRSDTLELSNPCKGETCPVTKDGKPATGRATLGKDMISWTIHEAQDNEND